jgi:hypothetical protein
VHSSGGWFDAGFILGAGAWGILDRGRDRERQASRAA